MKKFKKLIPALCMLLVSAVLLGSSTYAWFSMNNKVTVTGMQVTTKVSSNLLISATNSEAGFENGLIQAVAGKLEPVSTVDAKDFYWTATSNVKGDGDAKDDAYTKYDETANLENTAAKKTAADTFFNANFGFSAADANNVVYGYLDYAFYLKATSTEAASKVVMTKCNLLTYDENDAATVPTDKAWRAAMFANTVTASATGTLASSATTILAPDGAMYFTNTNSKPQAVKGATENSTHGDVTNYSVEAKVAENLTAGSTTYYYVVIRFWLEGEDTTCNNNTYASLTDKYALNLEFEIGTGVTGVTEIESIPANSVRFKNTLTNVSA